MGRKVRNNSKDKKEPVKKGKCVHGRNKNFCCECRYHAHNSTSKSDHTLDLTQMMSNRRIGKRLQDGFEMLDGDNELL